MNKKYSEDKIKTIVDQYTNGQAVALLCAEHNVPRSTIYFWIKQHRKLKSSTNAEVAYQDYHNLKREYKKRTSLTKRPNKLQQQFNVSEPNRV